MLVAQCVPYVLRESYTLNVLQSRLHGLDHWHRVWKNALLLTGTSSDADMEVVALFCLFHDSMRFNDNQDPNHGIRGYRLWERFFQMHDDLERYFSDNQGELLLEACAEHDRGETTTDPTIAVCWDADRLDLHRVGIWPDARYMSTQEAIALCMNRITP